MTWLDLATAGGTLLLLGLAYKRGIILELTDLTIIFVGGFFAFRLYRPIGGALHSSVLKGFSQGFVEKLILFVVLIVAALIIFGVGLNLQRKFKEDKSIDGNVDQYVGLVIGIPKTAILVVTVLGVMFYNNLFPARETVKLRNGPIVSAALGMRFVVQPVYYVVAPSDLAEDFVTQGLGGKKPKKKTKKKTRKKKTRKKKTKK
jgi:uncharacterized membrane protein required for colicin V production